MCKAAFNVVGVGNTLMGDDGVGVAAVERMARRGAPRGVELHDAGLAIGDVLCTLDPATPLIVIDALRGGGPPGSIYTMRLPAAALGGGPLPGCLSLHELSVLPALAMEALAGREFRDVTVFGIEPEVVAWGEGLSPAATAALGVLVEAVFEHIRAEGPPEAPATARIGTGDALS